MNPHLFPSSVAFAFFMIVTLSQVPTFLCADDEQYANCSQLFQCANIPNIGYPFCGGNRPDYCGHQSFILNCQGDAPLITIQTMPYRVLTIDDSTQTLKVIREELWQNSCPTELINVTLDTAHFTYLSDYEDLMLYFGCQRLSANLTAIPHWFDCSVDGMNNTVSFALTSASASASFISTLYVNVTTCQNVVSVLVNQTEAVAFASNPNSVNVTQLLHSGVGLQWDANNTICDRCIGSGGTCVWVQFE